MYINARCELLRDMGFEFDGRTMSMVKKDFNVHQNEISYSSDEEWDEIIEDIKMEMDRRAELKPFKDVEREVMETYWKIRLHKCGKKDIPYEEKDRNEFIDFLLDIDHFDKILVDVNKEWDMIMREYIDNYYLPKVKLGESVIFLDEWKYYN